MRTLGAEVECGRKAARKHSLTGLKQGRIMERNSKLTANARALRKSMTKEESRLWYQFLCRYKPRFHRQYVIGPYIADFYCHQVKLVVELDGSQHCDPEKMEYIKEIVDCTDAKIVLTPSWKEHWSENPDRCDDTGRLINTIFGRYGLKIYGKTPVIRPDRENEIKKWLEDNKIEYELRDIKLDNPTLQELTEWYKKS